MVDFGSRAITQSYLFSVSQNFKLILAPDCLMRGQYPWKYVAIISTFFKSYPVALAKKLLDSCHTTEFEDGIVI